MNFTLLLIPHGETFSHPASVVCELQDVGECGRTLTPLLESPPWQRHWLSTFLPPVFPKIKAQCTDASIRLQLHYGNMETQWWLFVGSHRLEPELVDKGRYWLESGPGYLGVEVPLFGPGMAYEVGSAELDHRLCFLFITLAQACTRTAVADSSPLAGAQPPGAGGQPGGKRDGCGHWHGGTFLHPALYLPPQGAHG